jgi:hypothetical protein
MKRKLALQKLLAAGWHGNVAQITDIYQASNIHWETAIKSYREGVSKKNNGANCTGICCSQARVSALA